MSYLLYAHSYESNVANSLLINGEFFCQSYKDFLESNEADVKFYYIWEHNLLRDNFQIKIPVEVIEKKLNLLIDISTGEISTDLYHLFKNFLNSTQISNGNIYILVNTEFEKKEIEKLYDVNNCPNIIFTDRNKILFLHDALGSIRPKKFLFLSRRFTIERFLIYLDLRKRNILKNTIFSFGIKDFVYDLKAENLTWNTINQKFVLWLNDNKNYKNNFTENLYDYWQTFKNEICEELPKYLDENPFSNQHSHNITNSFNQTYFSLVIETAMQDNEKHFQPSEKIYKSCFYRHPFVVYSTPKFIEHWKSCGYKSYDLLLDESYDKEINFVKRVESINNQIEILNNLDIILFRHLMTWKAAPNLNHNQSMISNRFGNIIASDNNISNIFQIVPNFPKFY